MGEQPPRAGASLDGRADVRLFPATEGAAQHQGRQPSGGEQQMLTICRSLLGNPLVILIDEPTEGLAPGS